jgi:hypothetical protein
VTTAVQERLYRNHWNNTDSIESLSDLISMNFDGLRDDVIKLLADETVEMNTRSCQNDLNVLANRDDVLTALAHLGYLGFTSTGLTTGEVFIPNNEVAERHQTAIETLGMPIVAKLLIQSKRLLEETWNLNGAFVAERLNEVHAMETSVFKHDDENSLAGMVVIAYFAAKEYYVAFREPPTGEGFADVVFSPRTPYRDKPTVLVELKWNRSTKSAIDQIKRNKWPQRLEGLGGPLLMVGINYDEKTKKHHCVIERTELPGRTNPPTSNRPGSKKKNLKSSDLAATLALREDELTCFERSQVAVRNGDLIRHRRRQARSRHRAEGILRFHPFIFWAI